MHVFRLRYAALPLLLITGSVRAQTDAGGLFQPWPLEQHIQTAGDVLFEGDGHIKKTDTDFSLSTYSSAGRWRLSDKWQLSPTLGYSTQYLELHTDDPRLPNQLTDTSVGLGSPIYQFSDGWVGAVTVALGYAGNGPFGETDAFYLHSAGFVGKQLGPESTLLIGIDYNGNRTIWPDVPVPGFAYSFRLDPTLHALVGFPYNNIEWKPNEKFTFRGTYAVPSILIGQVEYALTNHLSVFGHYEDRIEPFHTDELSQHDRLIFESHRIEAGMRFSLREGISATAALGYAFGQEFDVGFDTRSLDELLKVSDEVYGRLGLELRF